MTHELGHFLGLGDTGNALAPEAVAGIIGPLGRFRPTMGAQGVYEVDGASKTAQVISMGYADSPAAYELTTLKTATAALTRVQQAVDSLPRTTNSRRLLSVSCPGRLAIPNRSCELSLGIHRSANDAIRAERGFCRHLCERVVDNRITHAACREMLSIPHKNDLDGKVAARRSWQAICLRHSIQDGSLKRQAPVRKTAQAEFGEVQIGRDEEFQGASLKRTSTEA